MTMIQMNEFYIVPLINSFIFHFSEKIKSIKSNQIKIEKNQFDKNIRENEERFAMNRI
jgi:hypothetical protein